MLLLKNNISTIRAEDVAFYLAFFGFSISLTFALLAFLSFKKHQTTLYPFDHMLTILYLVGAIAFLAGSIYALVFILLI